MIPVANGMEPCIVIPMTATTPADVQRLALLLDRIGQLAEAIDAKPNQYRDTTGPFTLSIEVGQKFIRLVTGEGSHRSVHAFVNIENGDLLKAAGWKAPAKGARGNLLNDDTFAYILTQADRYGSYLYIR